MSRTKGSKNRPKADYVPSKLEEIMPVVDDLMLVKEKTEQLRAKPVILNGPVFDEGRIQKRVNDLKNHEPLTFEETPYPSNWNEMGKIQKLEWLTANPRK